MLIILGGLPGTGKTTIAQETARQIGAVHIRIDSIEHTLRQILGAAFPMNDAGYRIGHAVAEDNLRLGGTVIADSVNPLSVTRDAWLAVAKRTAAPAIEIEIVCSDPKQHRYRIENRTGDIAGLVLPTWDDVVKRHYERWNRVPLKIDTADLNIQDCVELILRARSSADLASGTLG